MSNLQNYGMAGSLGFGDCDFKTSSRFTFLVCHPLAVASFTAYLVHKLLELSGFPLTATPVLHALVEDRDARMEYALVRNSVRAEGQLATVVLARLSLNCRRFLIVGPRSRGPSRRYFGQISAQNLSKILDV